MKKHEKNLHNIQRRKSTLNAHYKCKYLYAMRCNNGYNMVIGFDHAIYMILFTLLKLSKLFYYSLCINDFDLFIHSVHLRYECPYAQIIFTFWLKKYNNLFLMNKKSIHIFTFTNCKTFIKIGVQVCRYNNNNDGENALEECV